MPVNDDAIFAHKFVQEHKNPHARQVDTLNGSRDDEIDIDLRREPVSQFCPATLVADNSNVRMRQKRNFIQSLPHVLLEHFWRLHLPSCIATLLIGQRR